MNLKKESAEFLAAKWRKGAEENHKVAQELLDRGFKFYCMPHGTAITLHGSCDIRISKQETIEL